ncbi:hypothetical protein FACS1894184_03180 [Clostridia bacterium]|nr:hypothetical protein FACS1894184_03180 [Clostridia bacterium]
MKIMYNDAIGKRRKELAQAVSALLETPAVYKGMPSADFEVGGYSIDKTGTITGPDDRGLVADLQGLYSFTSDRVDYDTPLPAPDEVPAFEDLNSTLEEEHGKTSSEDSDGETEMQASDDPEYQLLELHLADGKHEVVRSVATSPDRLTIQMPLTGFNPEALDRLTKLVGAKDLLIKAALSADDLPIRMTDETLDFPWFHYSNDAATILAYSQLVERLCTTAKLKQRVTAIEHAVTNQKYAMRCFLLSIGFIGDEYKTARKTLLKNLTGGSSAWKNGAPAKESRS